MTLLFILRHGVTSWNAEGRIQGHSDISLSEEARQAVPNWRLPDDARSGLWLTSPLLRARETASLLGYPDARIDDRLREMHWGQWEGWRLDDLREKLGDIMVKNEARGLDLQPPGGESPREVQERLKPLLAALAENGQPVVAVSHKGVMRALYALASGWDMTGKPPVKLQNNCCHAFRLFADGTPAVELLNIPLNGG